MKKRRKHLIYVPDDKPIKTWRKRPTYQKPFTYPYLKPLAYPFTTKPGAIVSGYIADDEDAELEHAQDNANKATAKWKAALKKQVQISLRAA